MPKTKQDLIPKRHHYFKFFIFLCGCLLPPIGTSRGSAFFSQAL